MAASSLVCKGEVVEAPTPVFVQSPAATTRFTATAEVSPDRCFKGIPNGSLIPVLFDGFLYGGPSFVLSKKDYLLFFLKPQNGKYAVVDLWFGALPVSRELGSVPQSSTGMDLLELDLKAGLRDSNPDRILGSIRMLGNMKHLRSTSELKHILDNSDLLAKTYIWQALIRLHDYSVLPAVSNFFDVQPEPPKALFLPRDRPFAMQSELANDIELIRDPATLRFLERFAVNSKWSVLRMSALQALRAIGSTHSAEAFLKALDDSNSDNAYSAMQGLLALDGGGAVDWVPTWKQFDEAPQFYANRCREWWQTIETKKADP